MQVFAEMKKYSQKYVSICRNEKTLAEMRKCLTKQVSSRVYEIQGLQAISQMCFYRL